MARAWSEMELLMRENNRQNDELARIRDEIECRLFTPYNVFPLTSDCVALAKAYRARMIERYIRSGSFVKTAPKYIKWYVERAIEFSQKKVDEAERDVLFNSNSILLAAPANCSEFEDDPSDNLDARWWSGIYQKVSMRILPRPLSPLMLG